MGPDGALLVLSWRVSGLAGAHKNGKESWLINQLTAAGFNVTCLEGNYEKVARIKRKTSTEVLIRNFG